MKRYILMHGDIRVALLVLDQVSGAVTAVEQVYETAHVPVGIPVRKGVIDRGVLNQWWSGRAIPASRDGIRRALAELNVDSPQLLPEKCLGLSLSDQYWICPADSALSRKRIHFFENPFSEDVGYILFGKSSAGRRISLMSPDNTTDGWLKKRWTVMDGKRCLLKGGSGAARQEPYNEVLASRICERLGIPHVSYWMQTEDGYPYSVCEDFITADTELISAWYIMGTAKKPNHVSVYRHYLNCCERLGIPGMEAAVNRMLVLDYLIVNEDRHLNNFGVIRRADTLEYLGAAPIYDSGTSLWFDKPVSLIRAAAKMCCKPFKNSHEEQIRLVTDFDWIRFYALHGIAGELRSIVKGSLFIDEARCEALCKGLEQRCGMLEAAAISAKKTVYMDDAASDVKKDSPYSG